MEIVLQSPALSPEATEACVGETDVEVIQFLSVELPVKWFGVPVGSKNSAELEVVLSTAVAAGWSSTFQLLDFTHPASESGWLSCPRPSPAARRSGKVASRRMTSALLTATWLAVELICPRLQNPLFPEFTRKMSLPEQ
jgi:hypothetical protein